MALTTLKDSVSALPTLPSPPSSRGGGVGRPGGPSPWGWSRLDPHPRKGDGWAPT